MLKRGDIHWVRLDPVQGSEIGKTRPALIVSNDINNDRAGTVTIVPITTATQRIYPFEVLIPKGIGNLQETSKAKGNQIRTVDKARIAQYIGSLPASFMNKIGTAIRIHLSLS